MADLSDGEVAHVQGSASKPYELKNTGGVYSCSCPAWRNQSVAIERRTCKHLRKLRGDAAEDARLGSAPAPKPAAAGDEETSEGPPLLLAEKWDNVQDLTGWWMSEKLDGVRAYWDGKNFISRLGNLYHAPDWFVAKLPPVPLDGELWAGRKLFQRTVSIVRRQDKNDLWKGCALSSSMRPRWTLRSRSGWSNAGRRSARVRRPSVCTSTRSARGSTCSARSWPGWSRWAERG